MKVLGVIPARYASSRLPGKPLLDICGHPMLWWVYNRVNTLDKLSDVCVATDDERIESFCKGSGIPVVITSKWHRTAADRLQEVSEKIPADFYLQINGDEPLINIRAVSAAIPDEIPQNIEFGTNIITEMTEPTQVMDASNIKIVFDTDMNALYMSRTPIPYPFKAVGFKYYKHVGIIGYNKKMLDFYKATQPGRLETIEGIDTMRFIDYGKQLKFIIVQECKSLSVDTDKDLEIVRQMVERLRPDIFGISDSN